MESCKIQLPFEPEQGILSIDHAERYAFWSSPNTIQWFKAHGYTPYKRIWIESEITDSSFPTIPPEVAFAEAEYPYPYADTETDASCSDPVPLRAWDLSGKCLFAQDSQNRHVAIKLVRADTEEYRVMKFLNQQSLDTLKKNCVIPILELLPIEGFWFAVMPRWGPYIDDPQPRYVHEIIDIMHDMLKGMTYLHENNIAHGDINGENVLVNHISDMMTHYKTRSTLRSKKCLSYALFDFDFSIIVPPGVARKGFRLPAYRSYGTFNVSHDTAAGEPEYDPFVLDVGSMGVLFCEHYQHLSVQLPMLAPLLDMMTTWDLRRRFTASEALRFFEDRVAELSEEELDDELLSQTPEPRYRMQYNEFNRWENLPPAFIHRWKVYREAPMPWYLRFLRMLCQHKYGALIVVRIRFALFRLSSLPLRIYNWLFHSKNAI